MEQRIDLYKKNKMNFYIGTIICLIVFFSILLISSECYGADIKYIIQFIVFLAIYIQVPGMALLHILKAEYKNKLTKLLVAFFCGCSILFAEYYGLSLLGMGPLIKYVNAVVSIVFISVVVYQIVKKKQSINESMINFDFKLRTLFYFMFILLCFLLNLQFQYVNPEISPFSTVGQDQMWHMGNINSLANAFPPTDYRVEGHLFFYHYFQDLLYGICLKIFGIPADVIIFYCSPYLLTYIYGGSILALLHEFCKKTSYAEVYGALFVVLNLCPIGIVVAGEEYTSSWFNNHIFTNVNCVAFAISSIIILVISLKHCFKYTHIIICICLIIVATGLKGPMAAVVMAAIVMATIVEIVIKRTLDKYHIIGTLLCGVAFFIVYLYIISGVQVGREAKGGNLGFSLIETIQYGVLYDIIMGDSDYNGLMYYVMVILIIILEMILLVGALAIPYLIYLFSDGKKIISLKKDISWIRTIIYFSILIGIGGFIIVGQSGRSQIYFLFTTLPLMYLEVICILENINTYRNLKRAIIIGWVVLGLLLSGYGFIKDFDKIYTSATSKLEYNDDYYKEFEYTGMLKEEYEGYAWIRENTNKDDVIATDRRNVTTIEQYKDIDSVYYYSSAYSQRQMYLEGHKYKAMDDDQVNKRFNVLKQIYDDKNDSRGAIAYKNGIDYVVVTKTVNGDLELSNDNMKLCYKNDRIKIYEIKEIK